MANWILNRVPYSKSDIAPHQQWLEYQASLNNLKVWGCLAYVRIPDIKRKLDPKANMCVFLDFVKDGNACRFLDLDINSIIEARDADFFEDKFIKDKGLSLKDQPENAQKSIVPNESISPEAEGSDAEEQTPEAIVPPSKGIRKQDFEDDFITYNVEGAPLTFKEAMQFKDVIL